MDMNELLERVTDEGGPFSPWVSVKPNSFGGVDIANTRSGQTHRVALDDDTVVLHQFNGGPAMLLAGTQTFNGIFASSAFVAPALVSML